MPPGRELRGDDQGEGHAHLLDRLRPERPGRRRERVPDDSVRRRAGQRREPGDHRLFGAAADRVARQATEPCYPTCGFYDKPSPGQLKTIFTEIAVDLQKGSSALIDNDRS